MSVVPSQPVPRNDPSRRPSPLQNGDRLSREEFERRYEAMPDLKKAELIEGIVYMGSPVRQNHHGKPHLILGGWLMHYMAMTPWVDGGDNSSVRLDDENEPQPDLHLRLLEGGSSRVSDDGYVEGPVELAIEIAASTVSMDTHRKLKMYREQGVREYLVWRVEDGAVDWFVRRADEYVLLTPDSDGVLKSEQFPGLWLHVPALLSHDLVKLLGVVDQGIAARGTK
jgi:Uma2 family endonuclease